VIAAEQAGQSAAAQAGPSARPQAAQAVLPHSLIPPIPANASSQSVERKDSPGFSGPSNAPIAEDPWRTLLVDGIASYERKLKLQNDLLADLEIGMALEARFRETNREKIKEKITRTIQHAEKQIRRYKEELNTIFDSSGRRRPGMEVFVDPARVEENRQRRNRQREACENVAASEGPGIGDAGPRNPGPSTGRST
jgi:hypothetical protein